MNERDSIEKLVLELRKDRVDKYEIERSLNKLNLMQEDLAVRSHSIVQNALPTLLPLMQAIHDDVYRLAGYTWRTVYLKNKRDKEVADNSKLYKELEKVDKEIGNLVMHLNDADKLLETAKEKPKPRKVEATLIVLIAISSFIYSLSQVEQNVTGFAVLTSIGAPIYFILSSLLVLGMLMLVFKIGKHH